MDNHAYDFHLQLVAGNRGLWRGLTAESFLELVGQLLDDAVALHVVHVLVQGLAGHLPQRVHVHPANPDGEDLDAGRSGPG